ncbi:glucose-6-phosphate dehydrogenase [Corynebacterium yudongzhengii]|uniref:Glucose-6-phosphate dehydrogenase n=1 Tax=Corynebacterium yudongzhengii TaxID=2080740 RepID=A0A2U1T7K5_9CORY|nr:glucose-6-phosphate dehydrogenase [Corynebacterium yudongzhengii]AWB81484.1 glucose-6-phosphate dehydrogenase [Corynebacterium yudongzhengii]PWC01945.1 glucose-6-phosphate dehydrogenase [Corynebacterium yudongzhengii]
MITHTHLLILGGASDLAGRLLLPGLADFLATTSRAEAERVRITAVGRSELDDYAGFVREAVGGELGDVLAAHATYVSADATSAEDLGELIASTRDDEHLIVYYALAPAITYESVQALSQCTLPEGAILALEKPLGTDAASAAALEEAGRGIVDKHHLYRIDHFLYEPAVVAAVDTLRERAGLRAVLNSEEIERLEIVYEEDLALEGRAAFYDSSGAVEDMVQSHLLQTMAHLLAGGDRERVAEILEHATVDLSRTRRGRYTAGELPDGPVPNYLDEEGVDPANDTETFTEKIVEVDTPQWRGSEILLRTGKAIGNPRQDITAHLRDSPAQLRVAFNGRGTANGPYARLTKSLLTGEDVREVPAGTPELAWKVVKPVLDAFAEDDIAMENYSAGSGGL